MFGDGIDTLQRNTQGYETEEEEDLPVDVPAASKKKPPKKKPVPPTLIVEVRSGCLDPDDIYTVHRADSSDAGNTFYYVIKIENRKDNDNYFNYSEIGFILMKSSRMH